jgi:hypothetical protein
MRTLSFLEDLSNEDIVKLLLQTIPEVKIHFIDFKLYKSEWRFYTLISLDAVDKFKTENKYTLIDEVSINMNSLYIRASVYDSYKKISADDLFVTYRDMKINKIL